MVKYELIKGSDVTEGQRNDIKDVYESKTETTSYYRDEMFVDSYYFVLASQYHNNKIIGAIGIDTTSQEIKDNGVHNTCVRIYDQVYENLLKKTIEFTRINTNLNDRVYYFLEDRLDEADAENGIINAARNKRCINLSLIHI